jgi:hypothetical protein
VRAVLARLALLALAAGCLAVAVHGLHRHGDCAAAMRAAQALQPGQGAAARTVARDVAAACDEPRTMVVAAAFVDHAGAHDAATALARRLVRQAPGAYVGWLTLGRLLQTTDAAGARAALARAHALNPRGVPPPARQAPRRPGPARAGPGA